MLLQVSRFLAERTRSTAATFAPPAPWMVRGLAPGAFNEDGTQNRDRVEIVWTVYADKSEDVPTERDRVIVGGDSFEVNGRPQDWTLGPWENPVAGVVVELKRMEG